MAEVRPYGDERDDGIVQLSFCLPLPHSSAAIATATELLKKHRFDHVDIVHAKPVGDEFTFFLAYARTSVGVEPAQHAQIEQDGRLSFAEVNDVIMEALGRPAVIVGAATGSDAHTVGLDSLLSMKGRSGDPGLERYTAFDVMNLGSQILPGDLADVVVRARADIVLISQVVSQRGLHLKHFAEVAAELGSRGVRDEVILVGGGPGVTMSDAERVGFDGLFGRGTRPSEVASFLALNIRSRAAVSRDAGLSRHG